MVEIKINENAKQVMFSVCGIMLLSGIAIGYYLIP
jgi:hypothetical protein